MAAIALLCACGFSVCTLCGRTMSGKMSLAVTDVTTSVVDRPSFAFSFALSERVQVALRASFCLSVSFSVFFLFVFGCEADIHGVRGGRLVLEGAIRDLVPAIDVVGEELVISSFCFSLRCRNSRSRIHRVPKDLLHLNVIGLDSDLSFVLRFLALQQEAEPVQILEVLDLVRMHLHQSHELCPHDEAGIFGHGVNEVADEPVQLKAILRWDA